TVTFDGLTWSGYDGLTPGALTLSGGNVSLNSNAGNIQIASIAGGSRDLTLAAGIGAGTTTVTGNVSALGDGTGAALTVANGVTGLVRFQGTFGANSGINAQAGTSLRFDDNVTLTDGDTGTTLAAVQLDGLAWSGFDGLTTGALTLSGADVTLDSNGGNIQIASIDGGSRDLTLAAGVGSGTTTVTGNVSNLGDGTGAALTVANGVTGLVRFQGTVGANSGLSAAGSTSAVRFDGDVTLGNGNTGTTLAGTVTFDGLAWSSFDGISFGDTTLSSGAVTLTSNNGAINFTGTVDGGQNLTLVAGTGDISVAGEVGGTVALGDVLVSSGRDLLIDDKFVANTLKSGTLTGFVRFGGAGGTGGPVQLTGTNGSNTLDLTTSGASGADAILIQASITATNGDIALTSTGSGNDVRVSVTGMTGAGAGGAGDLPENRDVTAGNGNITISLLGSSARVRLEDANVGASTLANQGKNTRLVANGGVLTEVRLSGDGDYVLGNKLDDIKFPQIVSSVFTREFKTGDVHLGDDSTATITLTDLQMDALAASASVQPTIKIIAVAGNIIIDRATAFAKNLFLVTETAGKTITDAGVGTAFQTVSASGQLLMQTNAGAIGTGGNPLTVDVGAVSVFDSGGQAVFMTDVGSVGNTTYDIGVTAAVGAVTITQSAANALIQRIDSTGTVSVTAAAGTISDHASDTIADITAGGLITLSASGNIDGQAFADDFLDLAAGSSVTASSTGGLIRLRGLGALNVGAGGIHTAGGAITITAAGDIANAGNTIESVGAGAGGSISIAATGAASDLVLTGSIDASGADNGAGAGFAAGTISLTAAVGTIGVANATAIGGDGTGAAGGNGGAITIDAGPNIAVVSGTIDASGGAGTTTGTGGTVAFNGPLVLGGAVQVNSNNGGTVSFTSTVNADDSTVNDRTLSVSASGGTVNFSGNVGTGGNGALADLDATAKTINFNAAAAQTLQVDDQGGNTLTFTGGVVLGQNVTVDTDGATDNNLLFASGGTVDGDAPFTRNLTVGAGSGNVTFSARVGTVQPLGDVKITTVKNFSISIADTIKQNLALTADAFIANSLAATASGFIELGVEIGDFNPGGPTDSAGGDIILRGQAVTDAMNVSAGGSQAGTDANNYSIWIESNILAQAGNIVLTSTALNANIAVVTTGLPNLGSTTTNVVGNPGYNVAERAVQADTGNIVTDVATGGFTVLNDGQRTPGIPPSHIPTPGDPLGDAVNSVLRAAAGSVSVDNVFMDGSADYLDNNTITGIPQIISANLTLNFVGDVLLGTDAITGPPRSAPRVGSGVGQPRAFDDAEMAALFSSQNITVNVTGGDIVIDRTAPAFGGGGQNLTLNAANGLIRDNSSGVAFQTSGTLTLTSAGTIGIDNTDTNPDVGHGTNNADGILIVNVGALTITGTGGNDVAVTSTGGVGNTTWNVATGGAGNVALVQQAANALIGAISTTGTVNVTATAGDILDDADDTTTDITAGGLITLSAGGNIRGPGPGDAFLDLANGSQVTATSTGNGAIQLRSPNTLTIAAGGINTGGGAIGLKATTITLNGNLVSGGGAATVDATTTKLGINPVTVNTDDGVGGGGNASFTGAIDATAAGAQGLTVKAGKGDVTFSGKIGNGTKIQNLAVTARDITVSQSIATAGNGTVTFTNSGTLALAAAADMSLDGAFLQDGTGAVSTAADITTTADDITFQSAVTFTGAVALNSAGGNILFGSTLDAGGNDLALSAAIGAGTTTFTGAVTNLGDGTGPALNVAAGVTGLVRFQSTLAGASGITAGAGTSLRFDGNVTLGNGDTGTTLATVQFDGLNWSSFDGITLGATTLSGGSVSLDSNGGNISIASLTGGSQNLTLAAGVGSGTTTFTGAVTGLGSGTGAALTVANGVTGLVRFQNTLAGTSGISAPGATSQFRFDGDVTLADGDTATAIAGTVRLDGLNWSSFDGIDFGATTLSGAAVTLNSNGGNIQIASIAGGGQNLALVAGIGAGTTTVAGAVSNLGSGTGAALDVAAGVTGLV
ncbi:MAG: hypothetical protein AB7H93_25470, partial [Vicinamibacterales bacterium]